MRRFRMKKYRIIPIVISAVLILALTACSGSSASKFENIKWVLESYGSRDDPEDVIEGTEITATFNSGDNAVSGSAGCNSYSGGYEIKARLSIGALASTKMWCGEPEGRMIQETAYLNILQAAEDYTVRNSRLTIDCGDKVLIFTESGADN